MRIIFDVKILSTGSDGNCVVIDKTIMIDAGISKKKIIDAYDINYLDHLLISHRHKDHVSLPFLRYVIELGKKVIIPVDVVNMLKTEGKINPGIYPNITIIEPNKPYTLNSMTVTCIPQKHHDIVNYAFVLEKDDKRLLYSTDLDTLHPSDIGDGLMHLGMFDVILLEGNYDELWLREYIVSVLEYIDEDFDTSILSDTELNKWVRSRYREIPKDISADLFRAVQNMRHLSKSQARAYVKNHLKENGIYYEIHRSSKFYEKPSDWDTQSLF